MIQIGTGTNPYFKKVLNQSLQAMKASQPVAQAAPSTAQPVTQAAAAGATMARSSGAPPSNGTIPTWGSNVNPPPLSSWDKPFPSSPAQNYLKTFNPAGAPVITQSDQSKTQNTWNQKALGGMAIPSVLAPFSQPGVVREDVSQPSFTMAPPPQPTPVRENAPPPKAGEPGSDLQDPGVITTAGKIYLDRVTKNLQGDNPLVKNAQATEDTMASRRAYLANKQTQENLAQSPFNPGSAQYQRAMDQSQAGVDAANQAGQNSVNSFTRQATADNMAAANNLEDQQWSRAVGERTNSQMQTENMANSITDAKAKYAFRRAVANGMNPRDAYDQIVGDTGAINSPYQSSSPGKLDVQAAQDKATAWITATRPDLKPGTPEFQKAVVDRMSSTDSATQAPITDANNQANLEKAKMDYASGKPLTDDQRNALVANGDIPALSAGDPKATIEKASNLVGKSIKLDGKFVNVKSRGSYVYKPGSSGFLGIGKTDDRHDDYVGLDVDGKTYYLDNMGYWYDKEPSGTHAEGAGAVANPITGESKQPPSPPESPAQAYIRRFEARMGKRI